MCVLNLVFYPLAKVVIAQRRQELHISLASPNEPFVIAGSCVWANDRGRELRPTLFQQVFLAVYYPFHGAIAQRVSFGLSTPECIHSSQRRRGTQTENMKMMKARKSMARKATTISFLMAALSF